MYFPSTEIVFHPVSSPNGAYDLNSLPFPDELTPSISIFGSVVRINVLVVAIPGSRTRISKRIQVRACVFFVRFWIDDGVSGFHLQMIRRRVHIRF